MESVLNNKATYCMLIDSTHATPEEKRAAEQAVCLIEIREAIEERLTAVAMGQLVIAKEIAAAIKANTEIQRQIHEQNQQGQEDLRLLLDEVLGLGRSFEDVKALVESHGSIVGGIVTTLGEHAAKLVEHETVLVNHALAHDAAGADEFAEEHDQESDTGHA